MHTEHRMRASDDRRRPEHWRSAALCLFHAELRARVNNKQRLEREQAPTRNAHASPPGSTFT